MKVIDDDDDAFDDDERKLGFDFGMPDPHPMDSTFFNTYIFCKMCYLNTLHKCLAKCVI